MILQWVSRRWLPLQNCIETIVGNHCLVWNLHSRLENILVVVECNTFLDVSGFPNRIGTNRRFEDSPEMFFNITDFPIHQHLVGKIDHPFFQNRMELYIFYFGRQSHSLVEQPRVASRPTTTEQGLDYSRDTPSWLHAFFILRDTTTCLFCNILCIIFSTWFKKWYGTLCGTILGIRLLYMGSTP